MGELQTQATAVYKTTCHIRDSQVFWDNVFCANEPDLNGIEIATNTYSTLENPPE